MFCGKCGKEILEGYEYCMNCGTKVAQVTGQEEKPVKSKNKSKKKWIISVVIILLVFVIVTGVVACLSSAYKKKSGLYKEIPWQTSYRELCEMIETKATGDYYCQDSEKVIYETIKNYKEDTDVTTIVMYKCNDDGTLRSVCSLISNGDNSKYTDTMLYDKYVEELTDVYGEGKDYTGAYSWTTPKSEINLVYYSDGLLTLIYEDKTYEKEE